MWYRILIVVLVGSFVKTSLLGKALECGSHLVALSLEAARNAKSSGATRQGLSKPSDHFYLSQALQSKQPTLDLALARIHVAARTENLDLSEWQLEKNQPPGNSGYYGAGFSLFRKTQQSLGRIYLWAGDLVVSRPALAGFSEREKKWVYKFSDRSIVSRTTFSAHFIDAYPRDVIPMWRSMGEQEVELWERGAIDKMKQIGQEKLISSGGCWGFCTPRLHFNLDRPYFYSMVASEALLRFDVPRSIAKKMANQNLLTAGVQESLFEVGIEQDAWDQLTPFLVKDPKEYSF